MLNRRQLRIKILQVLYAFYQDEDRDAVSIRKALDHSIRKTHQESISERVFSNFVDDDTLLAGFLLAVASNKNAAFLR